MNIALHDSEREYLKRKTFPNYALMKISAYHKSVGDTVEWWQPEKKYDRVYSSKIFDFTPENPLLPLDTIKGGTGYDIHSVLSAEIEEMFPDYGIYPECDYAMGYITRGCPNHCRWCVVPEKEGGIKPYRTWEQLVRPDSSKLVLMDNNILASEYGIGQLESLIDSGYAIDLNQGMDARLVTDRIAQILSRLEWIKYIRFSCDTLAQIKAIENAAELLMKYDVKPYRLFIYLLVTKDVDNAAERAERLKKFKGITLYAQAERNESKGIIPNKIQLEFAQRFIYSGKFRSETWDNYCRRHNIYRKDRNMGKINISSFSEPDNLEAEEATDTMSGLGQAYANVWGSSFEKVESIELNLLHHYEDEKGGSQPFNLNSDKIAQIMASAEDIGIVTPLIVRRTDGGNYQIIAGHHRYEAARQLNLLSVPCVVRKITDDEAFKFVAESNIQRDRALPSEYGKIFSAYMEKRDDTDMTAAEIAAKFGVSKKTMYRYISVASLNVHLQKYADEGKIQLAAAEIIAAFSEENQKAVLNFLSRPDSKKITPEIAKEFAQIVENYGSEDVPFHEFTKLLAPKPLKKYRSNVYNNIFLRFAIDKSEQELDELAEKLLTEYFESVSR
ncbi:MAG: ParB/RepB/Spo0J family partition protein [Ruminococcus flavefaciens]|nr:ParB/RepB/Spo0J family partition protein [Ruminococcus flavefaciens]MCM1059292.1 ParB/RepB/Spo0J family partition protein [Eubacterium sp.]